MKKGLLILVVSQFLALGMTAQNLTLVQDTLMFPITDETTASQLKAVLYNPGPYVVEVVDVDYFTIYGNTPFTITDTAFVMQVGDSQKVDVSFLPEHNIEHRMAIVVKTKSGFGHKVVVLKGQGTYSNTYYNSTENKSEQQLKAALNSKLGQGYSSLGYNSARDQMFMSIDNKKNNGQAATVNTLECIYTGSVITGYANRSAAQNGNPQFNTEHTFPQGKFNSNEPMKSDIHHLYPTTNTSNSQRGNDPFGMVTNPSWTQGGSKSGSSTFEPRDSQKGATARSMMYFVLRYQDYTNFFQGQETVLRNWHDQYPPTAIDIKRNDDIFALQNNRNPFVDYPQLIERITSLVSNATPTDVVKLYQSDDTIKLASVNGRYLYDFVLYNDGNKAINLSGFGLSDTSLHFVNTLPTNTSLQPQESLSIPISFAGGTNYYASLDFTTNVAGQVNKSIPILTVVQPVVSINEVTLETISIYPNPASSYVTINCDEEIENVWITDVSGKCYSAEYSQNQMKVDNLPEGLYFLRIQTGSSNFVKKVWVVQ